MIHASILTLTMALAMGIAVIALSVVLYRQSRGRHLLAHLYLATCVNLLVLVYVAILYFYQNLLRDVPVGYSVLVDRSVQFIIPVLQTAALVSLVYLVRLMLGHGASRGIFRSYGFIVTAVAAVQVTMILWDPYVAGMPAAYAVSRAVQTATLLGAYAVLVVLFTKARSVEPEAKRRSLRLYAMVLLVLLTIMLLCNACRAFGLITDTHYAFTGAVLVLFVNLAPFLYRKMIFAPGFGALLIQGEGAIESSDLRAAFNISPREKEVLDLICDGCNNQEIADRLFISLQTVKDHTSHIYKKIGVRSRVQLVTVLRDYKAGKEASD